MPFYVSPEDGGLGAEMPGSSLSPNFGHRLSIGVRSPRVNVREHL